MAVLLATVGNNEQINNSLNEINQGLTDLNSGISDLNNSMSDTNNFLKDENYSQDSITGNMPSNSGVSDITAESLNNIFNIIKDTFTSNNYRDIEIGVPFTGQSITVPSDLTESHVPTVIISLIRMTYFFLISRFIYKDIVNYVDKLKSRRHFVWKSN